MDFWSQHQHKMAKREAQENSQEKLTKQINDIHPVGPEKIIEAIRGMTKKEKVQKVQ